MLKFGGIIVSESEVKIEFKRYIGKIYETGEIDKNYYDLICEKIVNISEAIPF